MERYFLEVKDIPRLKQRIQCFIFSRTFGSTRSKVGMHASLYLHYLCTRHTGWHIITR